MKMACRKYMYSISNMIEFCYEDDYFHIVNNLKHTYFRSMI